MIRVWKVEEIGDYSVLLSISEEISKGGVLMPNPTDTFINKWGRYEHFSSFQNAFGITAKDVLYTPEKLILYFDKKTPEWLEIGMEVLY